MPTRIKNSTSMSLKAFVRVLKTSLKKNVEKLSHSQMIKYMLDLRLTNLREQDL
jgi:hypothetical protein